MIAPLSSDLRLYAIVRLQAINTYNNANDH